MTLGSECFADLPRWCALSKITMCIGFFVFSFFFYVTHVVELKSLRPLAVRTHVSLVFSTGKPYTVGTHTLTPWRACNISVLLGYLLDVNSSPGKHIHKLRVLSALLITMSKTEISIVSPRVHFSWVCNGEENTITSAVSTLPPPEI